MDDHRGNDILRIPSGHHPVDAGRSKKPGVAYPGQPVELHRNCVESISFYYCTLAVPVMPFDKFWGYLPTWQEWGIGLAVVGYGFLVFSLAYRYLPMFPKEIELNPLPAE
jgi:hypothetical protein